MNFVKTAQFNLTTQEGGLSGQPPSGAVLVSEIGHVHTRAVLFDLVEGVYRLVAVGETVTTSGHPWYDVMFGVREASRQISDQTGRAIINQQGGLIRPAQTDGSGVDFFDAVISAADPVETLIVALTDDSSASLAKRAVNSVYAREAGCLTASGDASFQEHLEVIIGQSLDLILVVGGKDGTHAAETEQLLDVLSVGLSIIEAGRRPIVLFAGSEQLREAVVSALGELTEVRLAPDIKPGSGKHNVSSVTTEIADIYIKNKAAVLPGVNELELLAEHDLLPSALAFGALCEYLAHRVEGNVVGLDIGANSVVLVDASLGEINLKVDNELGAGEPVRQLLSGENHLDSWSWRAAWSTEDELRGYILNRSFYPRSIAPGVRERRMEYAIAARLFERVISTKVDALDINTPALLVLRGGLLINDDQISSRLLMLMDSFQHPGIFPVVVDSRSILAAVGQLAYYNPVIPVQLLDNYELEPTLWVAIVQGPASSSGVAAEIILNSGDAPALNIEVEFGEVVYLPLQLTHEGVLEMRPARRIDVGSGQGRRHALTIPETAAGVLIDARGRPVTLPSADEKRRNLVKMWLGETGA